MRGATTHHVRTPMGQTLVRSDYGDDDLSKYREVPTAEIMAAEHELSTNLMAAIDGDMPAYAKVAKDRTYNAPPEAAIGTIGLIADFHPLEAIRTYNNLREPDMYDDGVAHWFGADGVVSVPVDKIRSFNAYVRCNGLIRPEACFTTHIFDELPDGMWAFIKSTCTNN